MSCNCLSKQREIHNLQIFCSKHQIISLQLQFTWPYQSKLFQHWKKDKRENWDVTSFGGKKENIRREKKIKRREGETKEEENRTHV